MPSSPLFRGIVRTLGAQSDGGRALVCAVLQHGMRQMGKSWYRTKLIQTLKTYGVWHHLDWPRLLQRVQTPRGGHISILTRTAVLHVAALGSAAMHRLLVDAGDRIAPSSELLATLQKEENDAPSPRGDAKQRGSKRSPRASGATSTIPSKLMTRLRDDFTTCSSCLGCGVRASTSHRRHEHRVVKVGDSLEVPFVLSDTDKPDETATLDVHTCTIRAIDWNSGIATIRAMQTREDVSIDLACDFWRCPAEEKTSTQ